MGDERHLEEGDGFALSYPAAPTFEATLRFATALVQDGMSGVTVVVPRTPGVLTRARISAEVAGVRVRADYVGTTSITMRFSGQQPTGPAPARRTLTAVASRSCRARMSFRRRLFGWFTRVRG